MWRRLEKLEEEKESLEIKLRNRIIQLDDGKKAKPSLKDVQEIAGNFDHV